MLLAFATVALGHENAADLAKFTQFLTDYGKTYKEDWSYRFEVFQANMRTAEALQAQQPDLNGQGAQFGVTQFSDLTPEEFSSMYLGTKLPASLPDTKDIADELRGVNAPPKFDWRTNGAITPIKNQAQCGSCWAFSATESIESFWYIVHKQLYELSPQEITSCSEAKGCAGGWPSAAMTWVAAHQGMMLDKDYPYTAKDASSSEPCRYHPGQNKTWATDTGFVYAGKGDEAAMVAAVATKGPLSVCLDASQWSHYRGGILSTCTTKMDHAVQIVAYDQTNNPPFWVVRNSWGTGWGEQGYIRMQMGLNAPQGLCLINEWPVIPTM